MNQTRGKGGNLPSVGDIFRFLDGMAPVALAESWDNVGLLCGDSSQQVARALLALDITEDVAGQAQRAGAQLVISHHPVIFHPLKALTADGPGAVPLRLAAAGISAVCMHTNLDVCAGGVNDVLAGALGLAGCRVLLPQGREPYGKIVTFVPAGHAQAVRDALTKAGAGRLGRYDGCTFSSEGDGTFRPLNGAKPFIGTPGKAETVKEIRVEAIFPLPLRDVVVDALRAAHPYEEPAFDIFPDDGPGAVYGLGRVGALPAEIPLDAFAARVKRALGCGAVMVCDGGGTVRRVAACGGSCDGQVLAAARRAGADTLVVGEIKHSLMLEARRARLNVVAAGHYETENLICPALRDRLRKAFPNVRFELAETDAPARVG